LGLELLSSKKNFKNYHLFEVMLYTLIELDPIVVVIRRGAKGLDSSSIRLRVNVFAMMSALG
jgi:hypothetical protein